MVWVGASGVAFLALLQPADGPAPFRCDYNVYSTFQSHEPEFDYLKSLEIEEKINKIRWLRKAGPALFLLTTNGGCSAVQWSHSWLCL